MKNMKVPAAAVPAAAMPTYDLDDVVDGVISAPLRLLVYGAEGIGKSTFASNAPNPIWLGKEHGTHHLPIRRIRQDRIRTFDDVIGWIRTLRKDPRDRKTLVMDPLNWFEPLVWAKTCAIHGWKLIEEPGFGAGYAAANDQWRLMLAELEGLYEEQQMNIIFVAHADEKSKRSPDTEPYDRYIIAINQRAAALFRQWCDYVLFARKKVWTVRDEGKAQGRSDGAVLLHTQWSPVYDAKSRPGLPPVLPFAWREFIEARLRTDPSRANEQVASLRERVGELLAVIGNESVAYDTRAFLEEAPSDVARLHEVVNVLTIEAEKGRAA